MDVEVDLDGLSDFEKSTILKVLQRNNHVKFREERRVRQLAVRVQIERMNDHRTRKIESQLKTRTGEWHRDMVRRRSSVGGSLPDVPSSLFRRLSADLISVEGFRSRRMSRSSYSPSDSPSESGQKSPVIARKSLEDLKEESIGLDMSSIKAWVDEHAMYKGRIEEDERVIEQTRNNKPKPLTLNIQNQQDLIDQREI